MTWQRIDENTYIDDTLVTCAEYQLFIDEMREQGKYYQPDHWYTYQFPEGQARMPILGVRHADATIFCDWLSKRSGDVWVYRLPTQEEAVFFPMQLEDQSRLGYWTMGVDKQSRFAWIGVEPRRINLARDFVRDRMIDDNLAITRVEKYVDNHVLDINYGFNYEVVVSPHIDYPFALFYERERDTNLARELARELGRELHLTLERNLDHVRAFALEHEFTLATGRTVALEHVLTLARDYAFALARNLSLIHELEIALDQYIDICTLKERIIGRSPAFEGIRLVRERIR